jgi:hypothetical protein
MSNRPFDATASRSNTNISKTSIESKHIDPIIKPYDLPPKASIASGFQKPVTLNINKLQLHIVGDSHKKVPTSMLDRSVEIVESRRRSHLLPKLDFDDQVHVSIEELNKSYLWKYKVKGSKW